MRILLAVDGSDNSYEAVRALAHFARAEEVMLLHVLDVPNPAYPKIVPEVANEIYAAVEQAMRVDGECLLDRITSLLPMDIGPVTKRLDIGSPAEVIANVAQERKTDLIVMGARGLGPVQERLFGSVSHRIVTLGPCATCIVTGPSDPCDRYCGPFRGRTMPRPPSDFCRAHHFVSQWISRCSPCCRKQGRRGRPVKPQPGGSKNRPS